MKMSIKVIYAVFASVFLVSSAAHSAEQSLGVWQTESTENGEYLYIEISACEDRMCGTIVAAFDENGSSSDFEHIGRKMIWGMKSSGDHSWKSGKIWSPDEDKTYKSKMKLEGNMLMVSGCIAAGLICKSQSWTSVSD